MGWHGRAWEGMGGHGMAWDGMGWHGMAWDGMARDGISSSSSSNWKLELDIGIGN